MHKAAIHYPAPDSLSVVANGLGPYYKCGPTGTSETRSFFLVSLAVSKMKTIFCFAIQFQIKNTMDFTVKISFI